MSSCTSWLKIQKKTLNQLKSIFNHEEGTKLILHPAQNNAIYTVCLKGQVKIYVLITRARKQSKTLER